jgi:RES domain-containing protein
LALLEVLVHLPALIAPNNYYLVSIEVPDTSIVRVAAKDLPPNWNAMQPPTIIKKVGDDFLTENKYLLLKVPSAIVPAEYNYLLNIQHPDMKKVKVISKELFSFDKRLSPTQTLPKGEGL